MLLSSSKYDVTLVSQFKRFLSIKDLYKIGTYKDSPNFIISEFLDFSKYRLTDECLKIGLNQR